MTLPEAVLYLLQHAAVPVSDRNEVFRDERLQTVALSIGSAAEHAICKGVFEDETCKPIASDENLVAASLTWLGEAETAMRSNVHRDECGPHQCDAVRIRTATGFMTVHLARGIWQMHRPPQWSSERWESIRGDSLEATTNAAWETAKMFEGYRGICGGTTQGAFAGYATGGHCSHPQAASRAARTEWLRVQIVALRATDIGHRPSAVGQSEEGE